MTNLQEEMKEESLQSVPRIPIKLNTLSTETDALSKDASPLPQRNLEPTIVDQLLHAADNSSYDNTPPAEQNLANVLHDLTMSQLPAVTTSRQ